MSVSNEKTTTVSSAGQVVIPPPVLEGLDWKPGTRLIVENMHDGVLLRSANACTATSIDEVFGMLKHKGDPKSVEDMDAEVLDEAKRQHECR